MDVSDEAAIAPLVASLAGRWPLALRVMGAAEARRHQATLGATHQLSILDPGREPRRLQSVPPSQHLHLGFIDTADEHDAHAPKAEHIAHVLSWTAALPSDARLVLHCLAGESRSTAIALGLLATALPPESAVDLLEQIRPQADPNPLVIRHFDQVLSLNGALIAATHRFSFAAFLDEAGQKRRRDRS